MAQNVINLAAATRPDVTERQREFAKELIGLGLSRLAITALTLGKDQSALQHADIAVGHNLIHKLYKELGYTISDARNARTPEMQSLVNQAARSHRIKVKIA
jgi:hypothetical protein